MFGKRLSKPVAEKPVSAHLQVMPEVFYGGRDPEVHFQKTSAEKRKNLEKQWLAASSLSGAGEKISGFFQKKWVRYIFFGFLFLLAIAGISLYYLEQAGVISFFKKNATPAPAAQETAVKQSAETPAASVEVEIPITTPSSIVAAEIPTTTPVTTEIELQFPQVLLTDSADSDNDSLTDIEEEVFQTDPGKWDTDGDGYYDGQEVLNLYNPQGTAPMKIIDSGIVQEYLNPTWKYRFYYPVAWQVGNVDPSANQVLVSAATGDFIEISAFKKESGESFEDWFAAKAKGQRFAELVAFTNRFQENGQQRQDKLTAYFIAGDNVYVLIYHPGTTGFIPFRQVMSMVTASFRPEKTLVEIPDQVALPPAP